MCAHQSGENSNVQRQQTRPVHIVEHTAPLRPHATFREALSSRPRVKIGLYCEVLQAEFNTNNFGHFLHRGKQTKEEKNNKWFKNIFCYALITL